MFADASQLPLEAKVEHTNNLYESKGRSAVLIIGMYFFVAVLFRDREAIRSKDPKKVNSFRKLCDHEKLHPDIKGATLRRWVTAAATEEELREDGIDTQQLSYSALREIAKIPTKTARAGVAEQIITEGLKGDAVNDLVRKKLDQTKGLKKAHSTSKSEDGLVGDLTREITSKFETVENNAEWRSLLLDSDQFRQKFNFREQSVIYERAVEHKKLLNQKKGKLEKKMEPVQKTLNFLEDLIAAFEATDSRNSK